MTDSSDDDLLDSIALGQLGKRGRPVGGGAGITFLRELTAGEILDLVSAPPVPTMLSPLKTLRTAHHNVAKLIAEGKKPGMISAITGRTVTSIRQLEQDPAFAELVSYYSAQVDQAFMDAQARLADLGLTAIEILQERMEDPEQLAKMGNGTILSIMESAMDRSIAPNKGRAQGQFGQGNGPAAVPSVTLNVKFGAEPGLGKGPIIELSANKGDEE